MGVSLAVEGACGQSGRNGQAGITVIVFLIKTSRVLGSVHNMQQLVSKVSKIVTDRLMGLQKSF